MSDIPKGPAETALAIADIQTQIFGLIEKSDNARCARVCRQWKERALDHVWNSMNSLIPLVQLLAPLRLETRSAGGPETLKLSRHLRAKDWENLMPYAERVKHLEIRLAQLGVQPPSAKLDSSVFFELARCRRMLSILPNLSALEIVMFSPDTHEGWPNHLVLFLHDGIRSFNITWFGRIKEKDQTLDTLFDDITDWAPLISKLTIHAGISSGTESDNSSISRFLSRLPYLETLRIKPFSLSQSVLNALASLQNLQTVQFMWDFWACPSTTFERLNTDSAFPRLKSIPLYGDLESIYHLLGSPNAFQNLLELDIHKKGICKLLHLHSLFDIIPRASPLLRRLTMKCNFKGKSDNGSVHAEILKPLTSLPHLEMLELEFVRPIELTTSQMADILGKCSRLTTLTLNTTQSGFSTMLTLDVLQLLSEACPQLVKLGLHVDARVIPSTPDLLHVHGFRNLRVLDLRTFMTPDARLCT